MSTLPDYAQALSAALGTVRALHQTERIALSDATGRVLAQPVSADRDLPPFNRSQMDGFAVRAEEIGTRYSFEVVGKIAAGRPANVSVPIGACVKIATGAPLPDDLDTVIQHEHSDRSNPVHFTVESVERGHAVHPRGADARAGDVLLTPPMMLEAHHLGIAAAVGCVDPEVYAQPRTAVLSSGDEVRPIASDVQRHEIRQSNAPMVEAIVKRFGATVVMTEHIADEPDATIEAVGRALESCDLVITIGGISAGERDLFPLAFDHFGVQTALRGAAIQPGRPIYVGSVNGGASVIGLPGNPVSSLVCANLFVRPVIGRMLRLSELNRWRTVTLADSVKPNPKRQAFRPARLCNDGDSVVVPSWAGSGDLVHTAGTHGIVALPVQNEPVEAGARLRFLSWW